MTGFIYDGYVVKRDEFYMVIAQKTFKLFGLTVWKSKHLKQVTNIISGYVLLFLSKLQAVDLAEHVNEYLKGHYTPVPVSKLYS